MWIIALLSKSALSLLASASLSQSKQSVAPAAALQNERYKKFWLNAEGIVVHTEWKGKGGAIPAFADASESTSAGES